MDMKTIDLQNCTDIKDHLLKFIVNGKVYTMNHQFLTIHVPDNKPSKIKIEYALDDDYTSFDTFVYTYSPKNNMTLQILRNRRLIKTSFISCITGMALIITIAFLCKNRLFNAFLPVSAPLLMMIHHLIKRKKFFVIQEVQKSEKEV